MIEAILLHDGEAAGAREALVRFVDSIQELTFNVPGTTIGLP